MASRHLASLVTHVRISMVPGVENALLAMLLPLGHTG
jgi:hypothetical protein